MSASPLHALHDPTRCACGGGSAVVETRPTPGGLRRRRRCRVCGARWTTYEVLPGQAVVFRAPKPRPEPKVRRVRVVTVRTATPVREPAGRVEATG